jgi:hypothetical protein
VVSKTMTSRSSPAALASAKSSVFLRRDVNAGDDFVPSCCQCQCCAPYQSHCRRRLIRMLLVMTIVLPLCRSLRVTRKATKRALMTFMGAPMMVP